MRNTELTLVDAGAELPQDLPKLGLSPDRTEEPLARADHRDRLVAERIRVERPGGPVESVLEHPGNRGVVLGSREENGVCARERLPERDDRERLRVDILVVRRDLRQAVPEPEL